MSELEDRVVAGQRPKIPVRTTYTAYCSSHYTLTTHHHSLTIHSHHLQYTTPYSLTTHAPLTYHLHFILGTRNHKTAAFHHRHHHVIFRVLMKTIPSGMRSCVCCSTEQVLALRPRTQASLWGHPKGARGNTQKGTLTCCCSVHIIWRHCNYCSLLYL